MSASWGSRSRRRSASPARAPSAGIGHAPGDPRRPRDPSDRRTGPRAPARAQPPRASSAQATERDLALGLQIAFRIRLKARVALRVAEPVRHAAVLVAAAARLREISAYRRPDRSPSSAQRPPRPPQAAERPRPWASDRLQDPPESARCTSGCRTSTSRRRARGCGHGFSGIDLHTADRIDHLRRRSGLLGPGHRIGAHGQSWAASEGRQ